MDSALSLEEFERLQNQLLELKSINYSLDERCKKNLIEINNWKEKSENLEKELTKLQNLNKLNPLSFARNLTLNKSLNNDKELIERLMIENENFQKKIDSQENEFKITTQTLKSEIINLVNIQKQLEQQILNFKQENFSETHYEDSTSQLPFLILAEKEQLNLQIVDLTQANELLKKERHEHKTKLFEVNQQLKKLQQDYDLSVNECSKANTLAESRKSLIDEMNLYIEEINLKQQNDKTIIKNLEKEKNLLNQQLSDCKNVQMQLINTQKIIQACLNNCKILNQAHRESQECIKEYLNQLKKEEIKVINKVKNVFEKSFKEWNEKWKFLQVSNQNNEKELNIARQKISDEEEEKRIHERKGIMIIKELRRELNSEKKRADKLQEKLEEILNEKSLSSTVMDIALSNRNNDSSSVGSWSFMSNKEQGGNECNASQCSESDIKDASPTSSPLNTEVHSGIKQEISTVLFEENSNLVSRVTKLQQEKCSLEEKINYLEMINRELGEDIAKKKEVIAFYCMEGRKASHLHNNVSNSEKLTVKKVVDFIKEKRGDNNLKESNRKLQRMLEETLTRNMHLQKDMETFSKEIERLKKN